MSCYLNNAARLLCCFLILRKEISMQRKYLGYNSLFLLRICMLVIWLLCVTVCILSASMTSAAVYNSEHAVISPLFDTQLRHCTCVMCGLYRPSRSLSHTVRIEPSLSAHTISHNPTYILHISLLHTKKTQTDPLVFFVRTNAIQIEKCARIFVVSFV